MRRPLSPLYLAYLAHLWLTALPIRLTDRLGAYDRDRRTAAGRTGRRPDRGDALSTAVIAVGLVLIAIAVIVILRAKATDTANSVCVADDPTTCQ